MDDNATACPSCGGSMARHQRFGVGVLQCLSCGGLFLNREDLGLLIEQENDWHTTTGPTTQPLPRIMPDMSAPAAAQPIRESRSFLDALFG